MLPRDKSLLELTAEDVMSRDVVAIPAPMSVRAAARRLTRAGVSSTPVVDELGRCIGVLSRSDLVRFLDLGPAGARRSYLPDGSLYCSDWQVAETEPLPADDVGRYMTADVVTVPAETPLGCLARSMLDAHIHRVIVTDPWNRPVGVVSSTDILAAVAAEQLRARADCEPALCR